MIIKEIDMASVIGSLTVTVKVGKTTRDENGMLYIPDMPGQRPRATGSMVKPGCYVIGEGRPEVFEPRV